MQVALFLEQNMRFALISGRLAILKKRWANYEQLLRLDFSCFNGQKIFFFLNIVASALKNCIISLIKNIFWILFFFNWGQNRLPLAF